MKTLLIIAWIVDAAAILYILRVLALRTLANSHGALILLQPIGILAAMIIASTLLYAYVDSPWARRVALLIAAGPPLTLGGGYGLIILLFMTSKGRWN